MDNKDAYFDNKQCEMLSDLEHMILNLKNQNNPYFSKQKESIVQFQNYMILYVTMLRLEVPTTCCYQHIKVNNQLDFIQYFVMDGLTCCVILDDFKSHNFYA